MRQKVYSAEVACVEWRRLKISSSYVAHQISLEKNPRLDPKIP